MGSGWGQGPPRPHPDPTLTPFPQRSRPAHCPTEHRPRRVSRLASLDILPTYAVPASIEGAIRRIAVLLSLALLASLTLGARLHAQVDVIRGRVTNAEGLPLPNVRVTFHPLTSSVFAGRWSNDETHYCAHNATDVRRDEGSPTVRPSKVTWPSA